MRLESQYILQVVHACTFKNYLIMIQNQCQEQSYLNIGCYWVHDSWRLHVCLHTLITPHALELCWRRTKNYLSGTHVGILF